MKSLKLFNLVLRKLFHFSLIDDWFIDILLVYVKLQ